MALKKDIRMPNGIILSYHRIAMIKIDINQQITVLVESYIDEEARNYEKDYAAGKIDGAPTFPYTESNYLHMKYSQDATLKGDIIQNMYDWLAEQPNFNEALSI